MLEFYGGVFAGILTGIVSSWLWGRFRERSVVRKRMLAFLVVLLLVLPILVSLFYLPAMRRWYWAGKPVTIELQLQVRTSDESSWGGATIVPPGSIVQYMIKVRNAGPGIARNLAVGFNSAPGQEFVPDSLRIRTSHGDDLVFDRGARGGGQHIMHGGLDVGHHDPGATISVYWKMRIEKTLRNKHELKSVGVARVPERTDEVYNVAVVIVD